MSLKTPVNGDQPPNSIKIYMVSTPMHEEITRSERSSESSETRYSLKPAAETRVICILQSAELISIGAGADGTNTLSKLTPPNSFKTNPRVDCRDENPT